DQLRAAAQAGQVRGLKGFGARTEQKILDGIARYESRPARIRLVDARERIQALAETAARVPGVSHVMAAGGVRRWKETVGTLRLVAQADSAGPALDAFLHAQPLGRLEQVRTDCLRGRLADGVALELCLAPPPRFATAVVRQTGARAHVQRLDALAAERGFVLAQAEAPD